MKCTMCNSDGCLRTIEGGKTPCPACSIPEEFRSLLTPKHDPVNHPAHYTQHPSGVECVTITQHMSFCLGNAVKYIWRADLKADALEDLRKARWYIEQELRRRGATP